MQPLFRKLLLSTLLGMSLLDAETAVAAGAHHVVTVGATGHLFSPQVLNISPGDSVTFTNAGNGYHDAVSDDGTTFTTGTPSNAAWSHTFSFPKPGRFGYYCTQHGGPGQGMYGTINVISTPVELQSFRID